MIPYGSGPRSFPVLVELKTRFVLEIVGCVHDCARARKEYIRTLWHFLAEVYRVRGILFRLYGVEILEENLGLDTLHRLRFPTSVKSGWRDIVN